MRSLRSVALGVSLVLLYVFPHPGIYACWCIYRAKLRSSLMKETLKAVAHEHSVHVRGHDQR